jgi:hypothetical protein
MPPTDTCYPRPLTCSGRTLPRTCQLEHSLIPRWQWLGVRSHTILDNLWSRLWLQPVECELDCELGSKIVLCTDHIVLIDK